MRAAFRRASVDFYTNVSRHAAPRNLPNAFLNQTIKQLNPSDTLPASIAPCPNPSLIHWRNLEGLQLAPTHSTRVSLAL